ncbi:MAG: anthranilate phosphoribosyltransferase [Longimicrobiales bacterium]
MTTDPAEGPSLGELIALAVARALTVEEAERAFGEVMAGRASQVQVAALLAALRARGEAATEIAGGVRALRGAMIPVVSTDLAVTDTCGTGGGLLTTFNISTAAALVAAGAGARIAKHGNRSFTSRCGSADVLEALGVRIELSAEAMAEVLDRTGIVFMFAPLLHPAMRHVAPVRRELGISTIMNLLGPLTNPAGARRQVVGVADPRLLELVAHGLRELGHEHVLVVHGAPGMDELSPVGETDVLELRHGEVRRLRLEPAAFGWSGFALEDLAGGSPEENRKLVVQILAGNGPPGARAAVALNAGAALYVAGVADSIADGILRAEQALDAGSAAAKLDELREVSESAGR